MDTLAVLELMPNTKSERSDFVKLAVGEILSENKPPLKVELILKGAEDTLKEIRKNKDVKSVIWEHAKKEAQGQKTFTYLGHDFTFCNRNDYKWKELNDPVIMQLEAQIDIRKAQILLGFDYDTGEQFMQPIKEIIEYLKIKFK